MATELGTGEAGLGTGDGGKDFLPRRFLMFEQELLWSLKQQANEIIRKKHIGNLVLSNLTQLTLQSLNLS